MFSLFTGLLSLLVGITVGSDCNWGIWNNVFPLQDGLCNVFCEGTGAECSAYQTFKLECSDDGDSATVYYYENDFSCSSTPTGSDPIAYFDCSNDETDCDYYDDGLNLYLIGTNNTDCNFNGVESVIYMELAALDEACVRVNNSQNDGPPEYWSSISASVSNGIEIDFYAEDNCTGTQYGAFDFANYVCDNGTFWLYSERENDSDSSTMAPGEGYIDGVCNFGYFNFWPVVSGECGYCEGCDDDDISIYLDCDSDYAVLYFFDSDSCSGSVVNYTFLDYFMCDLDYDCPSEYIVEMGLTGYEESECSGDEEFEATIPLVSWAEACIYQGDVYLYLAFSEDTIYIGVYLDSNCEDTLYYWQEISDGDCDNSTMYSFDSSSSGDVTLTGECNYVLWNDYWAMASFYCSNVEFSSEGETASVFAFCSDDYGFIISYDSAYCQGNATDYEFVDNYYCDADICEPDDIVTMVFTQYEDYDCSGDEELIADIRLASNSVICYDEGDYSIGAEITSDGFFIAAYASSDCTGMKYFNGTIQDGDCENRTSFNFEDYENQVVSSSFDCNFAVLGAYPLAQGYCGTCNNEDDKCGSDEIGSVGAECSDDGESATLYEYSDFECSDKQNSSNADVFQCNNDDDSDDCTDSLFVLTLSQYDDSSDCSGDATWDATLYLAGGDACLGIASTPFYIYVSVEASTDGVSLGYYLGSDCGSYMISNNSFSNNYCDENGGNSTMFEFSEYSGGSTSSSDDDGAVSLKFISNGLFIVSCLFALIIHFV